MKKVVLILLLLLALCGQSYATKRAYLICIGDYPPEKGWSRISSANDLVILSEALSDDFTIESISDSLATYANVVKFLNDIAEKVAPSDTVLIHFSCHGQQMNLKADPSEPDSLDEALVMYDAAKEYSKDYRGEFHLTDNEFGKIAEQIRYSIGDNGLLIVSFDACHSDSMFRGEEKPVINGTIIRGYAGIFGPEPDSLSLAMLKEKHFIQDTTSINRKEGQCDVIYISACKASDRNRETVQNGKGYGSLAYSIASAFHKAPEGQNVGDLINAILEEMKIVRPSQKPVVRSSFAIDVLVPEYDNKPSTDSRDSASGWIKYVLLAGAALIIVTVLCRRRKK